MSRVLLPLLLVCSFALAGTAPTTCAQLPKDRYELRLIRVGKEFEAIRFKVKGGESWLISGGKYVAIPETGRVPAGDYEVHLVSTDEDWMAFRINRDSGETWVLRKRQWVKVEEPDGK